MPKVTDRGNPESAGSKEQIKKDHTPGHHDCPACERARAVKICNIAPQSTFAEAFESWLSNRVRLEGMVSNARYLSERTEWDYRQYARALGKFFGGLRLDEIHVGHFREYHRARAFCDRETAAWDRQAGANRIRKEVAMLVRIMKNAGAWSEELDNFFEPLRPVHNDVARAMNPDEQHRFLHVASSRAEWSLIYWYSVVALQTTASTNEMRSLRLGDINLHQGAMLIRRMGAKNKFRIRTIPLESPEVVWALERLTERAREFGAAGPHHYLFPFRDKRNSFDPCRGMSDSGLKKRWAEVRQAADLDWLRPYDLRHTGITRMAEAGVPIQVIMSFAGHMTMRMQLHYTTISMMAKRKWAQSTWTETQPVSDAVRMPLRRISRLL
jgi:integrase